MYKIYFDDDTNHQSIKNKSFGPRPSRKIRCRNSDLLFHFTPRIQPSSFNFPIFFKCLNAINLSIFNFSASFEAWWIDQLYKISMSEGRPERGWFLRLNHHVEILQIFLHSSYGHNPDKFSLFFTTIPTIWFF